MRELFFLIQIAVALIQLMVYLFSYDGDLSFYIVNISVLTVIVAFACAWAIKNQTVARGYGFSIVFFFTVMSFIVSFQVPLEIVYGNAVLLGAEMRLVYDYTIVNGLVSFSSMMLNLFLLGVSYGYTKGVGRFRKEYELKEIPSSPLLIIMLFFFFVFLLTVNRDYVGHGHGTVKLDSLAASSVGVLVRISAIYLAVRLYNKHVKERGVFSYTYSVGPVYLFLIAVCAFVFLFAHNRVYPIMIVTPAIFYYFVFLRRKVGIAPVFLAFFALSVVATLFKIYGIGNVFFSGLYIPDGYSVSRFFFPFTAELAGSFYSASVLYSMWEETGFSLYGTSYVVGVLRAIPGLVGFMNINPLEYDTAVIATVYSNTPYGVGTTAIVDALVNFGVPFSFLLFVIFGYIFGRSESRVYSVEASIYDYVFYFTITILLLFFSRSSMSDLLGMFLFAYVFYKVYIGFYKVVYK